MSNWKTGDEVICVMGSPEHRLFKDKTYTLTEVVACACGHVEASWGVDCGFSEHRCGNCGNNMPSKNTEWFCDANKRFRKVEKSKQKASYRLCSLEILTQFPVIRETSDQEIKTTERETV